MPFLIHALPAAVAAGLLLAACANQPARTTQGQLTKESGCITAPDPARCKFLHDLAGGYPFRPTGGGD